MHAYKELACTCKGVYKCMLSNYTLIGVSVTPMHTVHAQVQTILYTNNACIYNCIKLGVCMTYTE